MTLYLDFERELLCTYLHTKDNIEPVSIDNSIGQGSLIALSTS